MVRSIPIVLFAGVLAAVAPALVTSRPFDAEATYAAYLSSHDLELVDRIFLAAERDHLDALGWQRLGLICLSLEQPRHALRALLHSVDLDPELSRSWFAISNAAWYLDDDDLQDSVHERAHACAAAEEVEVIRDLSNEGRFHEALDACRRFLREQRGDLYEVTVRGETCMRSRCASTPGKRWPGRDKRRGSRYSHDARSRNRTSPTDYDRQ